MASSVHTRPGPTVRAFTMAISVDVKIPWDGHQSGQPRGTDRRSQVARQRQCRSRPDWPSTSPEEVLAGEEGRRVEADGPCGSGKQSDLKGRNE